MRVNEALEFFKNFPKIEHKLKTLQEVGLGYIKLGQSATTLSGGEASRVKLAKELQKKPTGNSVFIMDEPTTGLDPLMRDEFLKIVLEEKERGATIIMSSNTVEELERVCDKVALVSQGRIVEVISRN